MVEVAQMLSQDTGIPVPPWTAHRAVKKVGLKMKSKRKTRFFFLDIINNDLHGSPTTKNMFKLWAGK